MSKYLNSNQYGYFLYIWNEKRNIDNLIVKHLKEKTTQNETTDIQNNSQLAKKTRQETNTLNNKKRE